MNPSVQMKSKMRPYLDELHLFRHFYFCVFIARAVPCDVLFRLLARGSAWLFVLAGTGYGLACAYTHHRCSSELFAVFPAIVNPSCRTHSRGSVVTAT